MKPLRQKMFDALEQRNFPPRTIEAYVAAVVALSRHYQVSPDTLSPAHRPGCSCNGGPSPTCRFRFWFVPWPSSLSRCLPGRSSTGARASTLPRRRTRRARCASA